MAQYKIEAGCGHTVEMQLYGKTEERTRRIEWMESATGKCNPCYAAMKRAEEQAREEERINYWIEKLVADRPSQEKIDAALPYLDREQRIAVERYMASTIGLRS